MSSEVLWEGAPNATSEHRTLGQRAYCHSTYCGYCYPDEWCDCCHEANGHEKVWVPADAPTITIDDAHPMGRLATLEQVANAPAGAYRWTGERTEG